MTSHRRSRGRRRSRLRIRPARPGTPISRWALRSPTGRTVAISGPVQRNFVHPAADQLADPAFPAGVSVDGRDVWRTRTVYDASGAIIHQDTFASHYAPVWGGPLPSKPAQP